MTTNEELLQQDLDTVKGLHDLAKCVDEITIILASALLELENPEGNHHLTIATRNKLRRLAEKDEDSK